MKFKNVYSFRLFGANLADLYVQVQIFVPSFKLINFNGRGAFAIEDPPMDHLSNASKVRFFSLDLFSYKISL